MYRFGELNVPRVRRIVERIFLPRRSQFRKPPELCPGCAHRTVFTALKNLDCFVRAISAVTRWAFCPI